jgi:hypothetical protein
MRKWMVKKGERIENVSVASIMAMKKLNLGVNEFYLIRGVSLECFFSLHFA